MLPSLQPPAVPPSARRVLKQLGGVLQQQFGAKLLRVQRQLAGVRLREHAQIPDQVLQPLDLGIDQRQPLWVGWSTPSRIDSMYPAMTVSGVRRSWAMSAVICRRNWLTRETSWLMLLKAVRAADSSWRSPYLLPACPSAMCCARRSAPAAGRISVRASSPPVTSATSIAPPTAISTAWSVRRRKSCFLRVETGLSVVVRMLPPVVLPPTGVPFEAAVLADRGRRVILVLGYEHPALRIGQAKQAAPVRPAGIVHGLSPFLRAALW